mgnify:CR=1 FL=1
MNMPDQKHTDKHDEPQQALSQSALLDILLSIQEEAENLPCGGIGLCGATQSDLDEANELGRPFEDDAVYHMGQQIWLEAQSGIILLSNKKDQS